MQDKESFDPTEELDRLLRRYPILRYFDNDHLADNLKRISEPFRRMAWSLAGDLNYCPETSTALRKLLEAKDCAVRAGLESREYVSA